MLTGTVMFKWLLTKPSTFLHVSSSPSSTTTVDMNQSIKNSIALFTGTLLAGALLLTGCQQQSELDTDNQKSIQPSADNTKSAAQSDSAAARIAQFQPVYVAQMQGLQRRLQAEYEALQAADASDADHVVLPSSKSFDREVDTTKTIANHTAINSDTDVNADNDANDAVTAKADTDSLTLDGADSAEINTSTAVGERDLEVLKRISFEPHQPTILTEKQIITRYQQAMKALYQPVAKTLNGQETDTLINVMTLVPELFADAEIAERMSVKSPALSRLIIQHQVWEQIEVQQALDMQQMKVVQQQEFEELMIKFNDTIEGYDQQIDKYEQTLKEFQ